MQMHLLRSMPHLQCSTIALLLSERLLKKWIQDKKQEALDKVAREHPSLGDALEIALQLVLTQGVCVVPKQSGNAYSVDALSDDSDDEVDIHGFHQQQMQQRPGTPSCALYVLPFKFRSEYVFLRPENSPRVV